MFTAMANFLVNTNLWGVWETEERREAVQEKEKGGMVGEGKVVWGKSKRKNQTE